MKPHAWLLLAGLAGLATVTVRPVHTQEPDFLQAALARPILSPDQSLAESQAFVEARLAKMPAVTNRKEWEKERERIRQEVLESVIFRGEARKWRNARTRVEWLDTLEGGPGYRIRKVRYEALPDVWIPALLYEPENLSGKVPVVLNVNGHDGKGKAADYKQVRCINQAKRGMLALNVEWFGMGQLRTDGYNHGLINGLDLCGTGGIATHYLAMKRGLDLLLSLEHADPKRVAVTGLSGGGWQTIFISSLDPRVTLTDPVAGYSSFFTRSRYASDLGDSEQTPCDLGKTADYAHLTAMMAPRPTLLTYNLKDNCCFASGHALPPLLQAAGPIFKLYGKESHLRSHVNENPGDHNYLQDNRQALYRMLGDHFYPGQDSYRAEEIPSDAEIKTAEQLNVPLPENSQDFRALALEISAKFPRYPALYLERPKAQAKLKKIVRAREYPVAATKAGQEEKNGIRAVFWKLRVGADWTVPAVELSQGQPKSTVLVFSDGGRKSVEKRVRHYLEAGQRVVALDPLHLGEAIPGDPRRSYLWGLMLGTVGERPLGLQAGQVAAAARWARKEFGDARVTLAASGPRTTTTALVAGGLERGAIARLELEGALGSFRDVLDRRVPFIQAPEVFCFGLYEAFDIPQLKELAGTARVRVTGSPAFGLDVLAQERPAPQSCGGCETEKR